MTTESYKIVLKENFGNKGTVMKSADFVKAPRQESREQI